MIKFIAFLGLFFAVIFGCGVDEKSKILDSKHTLLFDKYNLYLEKVKIAERNENQWFSNFNCDALLFHGLGAYAGIDDIEIEEAKNNSTNQWFRTPQKTCFEEKRSKSTISRDMFLGLYFWIYKNKRIDLITEIVKYGQKHSNKLFWIMGEGDKSRTSFNPGFIATTQELRYRLGGANSNSRKFPQAYSKALKGYEAHIHVLHIYLRYLITKKMSSTAWETIKHYADTQPVNALFTSIACRFDSSYCDLSYKTLLDSNLFPNEKLPTNKNYCGEYLFQRDQNSSSWKPCKELKNHIPIDFLFASAIMLNIN